MELYRVLLVDDEEDIREGISRKMDWLGLGFSLVGEAANGQDALELAESLRPDVILTDIKMPFMDGLELCRILTDRLPAARFVVFSGFDAFEYAKQAIQMNVVEYILKPINADELSAVLRRLKDQLDRERAERRNVELLRSRYTENLPVLRELFYANLLDGHIEPGTERERAARLDIDLQGEEWAVGLAYIGSDRRDALSTLSVQKLLEESLTADRCRLTLYNDWVAVIVSLTESFTIYDLIRVLDRVCTLAASYLGLTLTVGVVPAETLRDNYSQLLLFALFIVSFSIFLLVFVNLRLSEWITAPMKKLDHAVRELEKGVESVDFNVDGPYEVEHLSHSVQSMISTMRHLMEDVLHQEEEKRRSELDVLQSQINPHFLYNTLDSVVWMTENGRTQEAVVMLTALARFFRISLSKGSNIIPIGDEIEHARNYLTIQKMRYKNKFSADISVEPGVEKLYTIKLIIQPILENAIYHGMEYADGDGEIHIRAFREGETVVIEVEDNGPGMSEEIVEQLLKPTRDVSVPKAKGSGIGFRNVHQRIQLTFGNAYGLTIRSEPDNGTVVRICLPVLEEEDARKYRKEGER